MNDENILRQRHRVSMERPVPSFPYSAKDFQIEILERLEEMRSFAEALDESWNTKLQAVKDQRLLKFDGRTLIALAAVALSITGYVIQDARNSSRQDTEIEATKARVQRLEQIATTNTEARIRTEVQLGELRDGQNEIKMLIQTHDSASRKVGIRK
jgi:hypothetical protein